MASRSGPQEREAKYKHVIELEQHGISRQDCEKLAAEGLQAKDEYDKEKSQIVVTMFFSARKRLSCLRTVTSHMSNLFDGVTKGFRYKMRAVYAHFPVNLNIGNKGEKIEIRNFLGEKRMRSCTMAPGVTIKRDETVKDGLILEGNDIDNVSKSAALIHMSCLVKKKDIRKFLDGFYVSEKGVISDE